MRILAIFSLIIPIGLGFFIINILWKDPVISFKTLLTRGCLSIGFGLGTTSLLYFIWANIFHPAYHIRIYFIIETILSVLVGGIAFGLFRGVKILLPDLRITKIYLGVVFILLLTLGIVIFYSLDYFLTTTNANPFGGWDGMAIWNLHARFMYIGGEYWKDMFTPQLNWSHPDYPLLVPGFIARCWGILGKANNTIPAIVAGLFTFGSVGLLFSATWSFRNFTQALVASIVLASTPFFIKLGANQYADVPLGFFILTICVLFYAYDQQESPNPRILALAGVATGFIVWTKNEGWTLIVAVFLARLVIWIKEKSLRKILIEGGCFLAGILPVLCVVLYFKIQLAPLDDMFSYVLKTGGLQVALGRLVDINRYIYTGKTFLLYLIKLGEWKFPILLVFIIYSLLIGVQSDRKELRGLLTIALILGVTFVQYFFVYILTPHNLVIHINSSLDRLLMQLFPGFVFMLFMWVRKYTIDKERLPAE